MSAPLWISHRGLCDRATENTANAFRAALDAGFSHLETDLRSTADGHLVLAHDEDLSRVAGLPLKVTEATRQELEQVRLTGGEPLLFFDQWLKEFGQHHWILDIKPEYGERTLALLLKHWQGEGEMLLSGRARFLFWDPRQQQLLLDEQPEVECMAPMPECRRAGLACAAGLPPLAGIQPGATYSLPPRLAGVRLLRPAIVDRYRRRQGRVLAFLPESQREVDWALESGVDEVLTNYRPG